MATVTTSKRGTLDGRDFVRGLLMTVISAILTAAVDMLQADEIRFNWKAIAIGGAIAGLSYLIKNLGSPSEIVVKNADNETVDAVKKGEATVKVETQPGK